MPVTVRGERPSIGVTGVSFGDRVGRVTRWRGEAGAGGSGASHSWSRLLRPDLLRIAVPPSPRPLLVAATLLAVATLAPSMAAAEGGPPPPVAVTPRQDPDAATEPPGEDLIHPDLRTVPVEGAAYQAAVARLGATERRMADAERRGLDADALIAELTLADAALVEDIALTTKRRDKSVTAAARLGRELRALAVSRYVRGGVGTAVDPHLDFDDATAVLRADILVDAVDGGQRRALATHLTVVSDTTAHIERQTLVLDEVRRKADETRAARVRAGEDLVRFTAEREEDRRRVAEERVLSPVIGLDFPLIVLDAYYRAAATFGAEIPTCGLRWQSLAAIGRTEGVHGSYLGNRVLADGNTERRIVGPPLDGTGGNARVTDTDDGRYDDDTVLDRGVGPMGFLPTSWEMLGRDGNGDGVADPHNIYDSALAAANLLCRLGSGLDTDDGLRRAYFVYNRSERYVQIVLDRTHGYDQWSPGG